MVLRNLRFGFFLHLRRFLRDAANDGSHFPYRLGVKDDTFEALPEKCLARRLRQTVKADAPKLGPNESDRKVEPLISRVKWTLKATCIAAIPHHLAEGSTFPHAPPERLKLRTQLTLSSSRVASARFPFILVFFPRLGRRIVVLTLHPF